MRKWLAVIVSSVCLAACGGASTSAGTTAPEPTSTTLERVTTTDHGSVTSTTTIALTSTTAPAIDVEFSGGTVTGPEVFEVALGEMVDIRVFSDVDDEMHVHGYDLHFDLEAGVPFRLTFPADVPGIFEVEVHTGHTHLFDIRVSG